jgi:hypothetical protein
VRPLAAEVRATGGSIDRRWFGPADERSVNEDRLGAKSRSVLDSRRGKDLCDGDPLFADRTLPHLRVDDGVRAAATNTARPSVAGRQPSAAATPLENLAL